MKNIKLNKNKCSLIIFILSIIIIQVILGFNFNLFHAQNIPSTEELENHFDASSAYNHIISQIDFGYRLPGSVESNNCINWVASKMENYCTNYFYDFTVQDINCRHLISKMNEGMSDIVIFAAHYDSRLIAEKDLDESKQSTPIDGANDGASGVAVLIELAKAIYLNNIDLNSEVWFLFIDAEDQGSISGETQYSGWDWCEGSQWLANDMTYYPEKYFTENNTINSISSFILLDMVGGENLAFIRESHSSTKLMDTIYQLGYDLGYTEQFPLAGPTYGITDDHVYFAEKGIPTVDLIINFWDLNSGWPYHHTTEDNINHISEESLYITGETLLNYVWLHLNNDIIIPTPSPTDILGDANNDTKINIVDALLISQYSVGIELVGFNTSNADVNKDGAINIIDALLVSQYHVGKISGF